MKIFLAFCALVVAVSASCRDLPVVDNFVPEKYFGKWYEYLKSEQTFDLGNCGASTYEQADDGENFVIVDSETISGKYAAVEGIGRWAGEVGEARFNLSYPSIPKDRIDNVLATDYTTYSLLYVCDHHVESIRILTRAQKPDDETIAKIAADMHTHDLSRQGLRPTSQINCVSEE